MYYCFSQLYNSEIERKQWVHYFSSRTKGFVLFTWKLGTGRTTMWNSLLVLMFSWKKYFIYCINILLNIFRLIPVFSVSLSILTNVSPYTLTAVLSYTVERGVMKFHLTFSLFPTVLTSTCWPVSLILYLIFYIIISIL